MTDETETQSFIKFEKNDFIVRISPHVEGDEWNGDIDVGMLTTDYNDLNTEDFAHLRVLTEMLISAIPLMETNPEFRHQLLKLVDETFNSDDVELKPLITSRDENVVKVNF